MSRFAVGQLRRVKVYRSEFFTLTPGVVAILFLLLIVGQIELFSGFYFFEIFFTHIHDWDAFARSEGFPRKILGLEKSKSRLLELGYFQVRHF